MYEDHYGLRAKPFAESTAACQYVPLPSREAVLARLRYGLEHGQGPVLLFGPPGAGKSLLAGRLADEIGRPTVRIPFPALPAADLLAFLADELDPQPTPTTRVPDALRRIRSAVAERRPLILVDEADAITDPATFDALRMLSSFPGSSGTEPDLLLVLVGGPELVLRILPALADRLTARGLLGPLSADESAAYVLGRLDAAGADPARPLFEPPALEALHYYADGLPRRLNRLADLALLISYAQERMIPDEATVALAARELGYDTLAA